MKSATAHAEHWNVKTCSIFEKGTEHRYKDKDTEQKENRRGKKQEEKPSHTNLLALMNCLLCH